MGIFRCAVVASAVMAAAFFGPAAVAAAEPTPTPPIPGPGPGNSGTRDSLTDQTPGDSGNSGWGYLGGGAGVECQDAWITCGSIENPPDSNSPANRNDDGGWVSAPGQVGSACDNPGVVCTDVS